MNYEEIAPAADKWLHADGSVTTAAGEVILPADQNRAAEYKSRAASADKWLHPDGSVTDSAGHAILPSDESRAQDYESRAAGVGGGMPGERFPTGFAIKESWNPKQQPSAKGGEMVALPFVIGDGVTFAFVPFAAAIETIPGNMIMNDAATAALS